MGLLIEGKWHDQWYDTEETKGRFERSKSQFRHWITEETAESGRYHLYVSLACPWAHRTLIFRALKNLASHIDVSVVSSDMGEKGWAFDDGDDLFGFDHAYQLYTKADPNYTGRVTVPILWDKKENTIVSNESAEIIRMFNSAFNKITGNTDDYYPEPLRAEIDEVNTLVYETINNGVYKCGFATTQEAYDEAITPLFESLDNIEHRLANGGPYLLGEALTEADWRLFTTLIRFDPVYVGHFKCNLRAIKDYPALSAYVRKLYHHPGVADTVNFEHIKRHYYYSHVQINPTQIVPMGPSLDWLLK